MPTEDWSELTNIFVNGTINKVVFAKDFVFIQIRRCSVASTTLLNKNLGRNIIC